MDSGDSDCSQDLESESSEDKPDVNTSSSVYQIYTHTFQVGTTFKSRRRGVQKGNVVENCSLFGPFQVLDN